MWLVCLRAGCARGFKSRSGIGTHLGRAHKTEYNDLAAQRLNAWPKPRWSQAEKIALELIDEGKSTSDIAASLGRSSEAIRSARRTRSRSRAAGTLDQSKRLRTDLNAIGGDDGVSVQEMEVSLNGVVEGESPSGSTSNRQELMETGIDGSLEAEPRSAPVNGRCLPSDASRLGKHHWSGNPQQARFVLDSIDFELTLRFSQKRAVTATAQSYAEPSSKAEVGAMWTD